MRSFRNHVFLTYAELVKRNFIISGRHLQVEGS